MAWAKCSAIGVGTAYRSRAPKNPPMASAPYHAVLACAFSPGMGQDHLGLLSVYLYN